MIKNTIISLTVILLLSACSGDDSTDTTVDTNPTIQKVVIINGHTLPPVPDKTLNDSTLLGIDSNDNGVRDDVEIWIYETYQDKHPVHIDIAMQAGRAWQKVLEDPSRAEEIYPIVDAAQFCEGYFSTYAKYNNEAILVHEHINNNIFNNNIFNTKARKNSFWEYDTLLSGKMYSVPFGDEAKQYCDFNTSNTTEVK